MTTPFDLVRYGWDLAWWATIEGIPVVWGERTSGLSLPAYVTTESPDLLIEDVGQIGIVVEPDEGIAAGFPFAMRLRDSATARTWLAWPSTIRRLTANASASATTLHVDDTTGLTSPIWIGNEAVAFSGSTATTLTGCTRARFGSLAYAHRADGSGGLVASAPLPDWRGRRVRVYAAAIDPAGAMHGASLAAVSVEVWSGYADEGPYRDEAGCWRVDCLPLVRRLAEPLPPSHAGVVDASTRWHSVQGGDSLAYTLKITKPAGTTTESFAIVPYTVAGLGAPIATKAGSTIRKDVLAAWDAAVTAMGGAPYTGDLLFEWMPKLNRFRASLQLQNVGGGDFEVDISITVNGQTFQTHGWVAANLASYAPIPLTWNFPSSPFHPAQDGTSESLAVQLAASTPADVTAPGAVEVKGALHRFATASAAEGAVRLGAIVPPVLPVELDGEAASVVQVAAGAFADVVRRVIASSGTAALRGSFDVLASDAGYAIDEAQVDAASFAHVGGALAGLYVEAVVSGSSLADLVGGMLGLAERAVVQRFDASTGAVRLALVGVSPVASGSVETIADDDLLTAAGEPPVVVERGARTPTTIDVELGAGTTRRIVAMRDSSRRQAVGAVALQAKIPVLDADVGIGLVAAWAGARFGRLEPADRLRLRVGPWVAADVGDVVQLALTRHVAIYDRRTGTLGAQGPARVVGRLIDPATGVVEVIVVRAVGAGLAPAARVEAFAGPAGAPTTIDVPAAYLMHFERTIESNGGGAIKVLHFKPLAVEGVADGYSISAAVAVGGVCRLTVSAIIGTPSLATSGDRSWLTIPQSGDAAIAEYQTRFAHTDDGGFWS